MSAARVRGCRRLVAALLLCAGCGGKTPDAVGDTATAQAPLIAVDVTCTGDQHRRNKVGAHWLRWDQQSWCLSSPASGTFRATVQVTNPPDAEEAFTITDVQLVKITPRPAHEAFLETVGPLEAALTFERGATAVLARGSTADLVVRSAFVLDTDAEGARANFHLSFGVKGHASGDVARFDTTVHVSSGAAPDDSGGPHGGEPPGKRRDRERRGPKRGPRGDRGS